MKTCIKAFVAVALLLAASVAWASPSPALSLGSYSGGYVELDLRADVPASVAVYQNGNLVFACDTAGVLTAAPGVTWTEQAGGYYVIEGLPAGNYTATLDTGAPSYTYSSYPNHISWTNGYSWAYVDFIGF